MATKLRFLGSDERAARRAEQAASDADRRAGEASAAKAIGAVHGEVSGVQARTVMAKTGPHADDGREALSVRDVDHTALIHDVRRGEVKVEKSSVKALFDRNACAVMRLAADELIDEDGVKAALRFAWAGDRCFGPVRVRTIDLDRAVGGGHDDGLTGAEIDVLARADWNVARVRLMRAEFTILERVMRYDQTAPQAAKVAYPRYSDRKKLSGMGDQALISACETLSVEYGYKPRRDAMTRARANVS